MDEFKFEITKKMGILSENAKGWTKEVNMVSWNERKPKLDIREWSPDHDKMAKGITLTHEETEQLIEILKNLDQGDFDSGK